MDWRNPEGRVAQWAAAQEPMKGLFSDDIPKEFRATTAKAVVGAVVKANALRPACRHEDGGDFDWLVRQKAKKEREPGQPMLPFG